MCVVDIVVVAPAAAEGCISKILVQGTYLLDSAGEGESAISC